MMDDLCNNLYSGISLGLHWEDTNTHTHKHTHTNARIHTLTQTHTHAYRHTHTHTLKHRRAHLHTHTHTSIFIIAHVRTKVLNLKFRNLFPCLLCQCIHWYFVHPPSLTIPTFPYPSLPPSLPSFIHPSIHPTLHTWKRYASPKAVERQKMKSRLGCSGIGWRMEPSTMMRCFGVASTLRPCNQI